MPDRSGPTTHKKSRPRRCDICRHGIAQAGPSYELRQFGDTRSRGKLRFRFCHACYVVIAASLERTIKKNWGEDGE